MNIASRQRVLWPCHAFSISIPRKQRSTLNVFEETVLKITEIVSGDTGKIAEITCLDKEFVIFIQNRLNQLGLINSRRELSEQGEILLKSRRYKSVDNIEYVAGTVFLDLLTGKLLPYIHIGKLKYEKIISLYDDSVVIEFGPTGKSQQRSCKRIYVDRDKNFWKTVPESNDIIRAIRQFKKKYKQHVLLNENIGEYPPAVPMAEAISVQGNPELVYLHCTVIVQIGNSDLLVTDGFGLGFSESFAEYLTKNSDKEELKWILDFKEKGVNVKIETDLVVGTNKKKDLWIFPEITKRFVSDSPDGRRLGINSLLNRLGNTPTTTNEEKDYIEKRQQVVSKLYASLEWALRYVISDHPVDEWGPIYKSQNFKDNKEILCSFAKKIGFLITDKDQSILQVKAGAIRQIEMGKVELEPLVAMAITGAATRYANHPFYLLSKNHVDFFSFLSRLKKMRDPVEHGDIVDYKIDSAQINKISDTVSSVIVILLPSISKELQITTECISGSNNHINQDRLKAQVQIEKEVGLAFFSTLSPDIKELLIRCELMLNGFAEEANQEIINCLSSVMQLSLWEATKNRRPTVKNLLELKEVALANILSSGFYPSFAAIPEQISTVNNKRLYHAVQGTRTTLGAHLVAVFLLVSMSELIQLKNSDPTFIEFIAKLICLRGHGNKQLYSFSRIDMDSLKHNVLKAIKIIKEVL
ncbi:MAG: hypothetical protein HQK52_12785 [Oligoflexia bacterium]|nr:hypothetical protein [Oligoflexia bacterium]